MSRKKLEVSDAVKKERILNRVAIAVSALVLFIVGLMRRVKIDTAYDFSFLPPIHATLNALAAIVLIFAFFAIKNGNIKAHRQLIYTAMGLSALFLISYVVYHFTTDETQYGGTGMMRSIYFTFLISHVILAGVILPFILFTFNRAITGQYERHKKIARWVFPIWLYVCISGPICYLMLRPYYN